MILGDNDLKTYIQAGKLKISNITPESIRENGIDCQIANTCAIDAKMSFDGWDYIVDTHNEESIKNRFEVKTFDKWVIVPAQTNILFVTKEVFELPDDLMAFCGLRSTVARMGFISPITIVDAGFKGTLTIEAFNGGKNAIKIYAGDRFLHVIFAKINTFVGKPYNGTYTGQTEVRLPKRMS